MHMHHLDTLQVAGWTYPLDNSASLTQWSSLGFDIATQLPGCLRLHSGLLGFACLRAIALEDLHHPRLPLGQHGISDSEPGVELRDCFD